VTFRAALAAVLAAVSFEAAAGELDTDPAVLAAQSWLASIDAGQYQQGWEDAADSLHVAATREQWEKQLRRARDERGAMLSRAVRHARFTKSSYSDPGSFVEIQFVTRFEKRIASLETVSAIRVMDGTWKVSSYTIK
jgi:hypothetical protein